MLQHRDADLPTPITYKSGGFEKEPKKAGDQDLKTGDFKNMRQMKTTTTTDYSSVSECSLHY